MKTTIHPQLMILADKFANFTEKTKLAEQAIRAAKQTEEQYKYLLYAVDQYSKYGHMTCERAKAAGATWFGDFTCTRELAPAKAAASYYRTKKISALREYIIAKNNLLD